MSGLVKHFRNTMKGIPQLSNNWGSMITLLDAVLVTGFNFNTITSLSKSSTDAITATINLGTGHGFIDRQVIRITDSTNGWNGDFKVLSANTNNIIIECTSEHPISISGTASCSTAPLDFELVYSTAVGSSEPKRAYRSTDPDSLRLILLVHDFCVSGAAANGAKFAKVGVVSGMSDIDSIVGVQMPFDPNNVNANWGWDGTYHGWAKWYYATPEYSYGYDQRSDATSPSDGNRGFYIVSDGVSILLTIDSGSFCTSLYGVAEFYDYKIQGKNLMLAANGITGKIEQSRNTYAVPRGGLAVGCSTSAAYGEGVNQRAKLWYNNIGITNQQNLSQAVGLGFLNNSPSALSIGNPTIGFYMQYPIIDNLLNFRGILPFARLKLNSSATGETITESGIVLSISIDAQSYGRMDYCLNLEQL
ncbi:hypothetical protein MKL32_03675 [Acinetobacter sp. AOR34_HL]|uniref:hypothetical protein n=1 Tax=Acinetobacter sp. AOR34_HL TaxID=2919384 RepID=UPI0022EA5C5D|nr:hypothetical protein [Acinetobacter sp. AOR34_HL]MDA3500711.1 hypothetical protein [Acinetobacter sp. AOR34_HL]